MRLLLALSLLLGARATLRAEQAWTAYADAPMKTRATLVARAGGQLFFISGNDVWGPTSTVRSYDIAKRVWKMRAPAPEAIAYSAIAANDGKIYLAGGCIESDCGRPTVASYVYDPAKDSWTPLPPLPEPVWGSQGASLDGKFFVFGGVAGRIHENGASAGVYRLDPKATAWVRMADMPRPRMNPAGAALGGKFVLTGGCSSVHPGNFCDTIALDSDAFDPATGKWSPAPALPAPLQSHSAISMGDAIVVAGGAPGSAKTYRLERGAKSWVAGPDLLRPRYLGFLFPLTKGVGMYGPGPTGGESLIEALGEPEVK